jgi:putative serine protease PepD
MWLTIRAGADTGKVVEIKGDHFVIGRDESADLMLRDSKVSRRHAYFKELPDGRVALHDLKSANGTRLDGEKIDEVVLAGNDEQVQIGDTVLVVTKEKTEARDHTVIETGIPKGAPRSQSRSMSRAMSLMNRAITAQRSARRITIIGVAALTVALIVGVLFATGVISTGEGSAAEVVDAVQDSTVLVQAETSGQPAGNGSGWVLDAKNGLIVTNAHVVNDGTEMKVGVAGKLRKATIVGVAPCEDLAVLKVADASGLKTMPIGSQGNLKEGQSVVAVGFPANASLSAQLTSTVGVVSVAKTQYKEQALDVPTYTNVVQTDAAINPGNSGGPLVRVSDKKLVGVNSASRTTSSDSRTIQGQGYAIGVDRVKEVMPRLRKGESIGWTGMLFTYPDPSEPGAVPGIQVATVVPGSEADKAGFGKQPLVIVGVNGNSIQSTLQSYCDAVKGAQSGSTATFTVVDAGGSTDTREIKVKME